MSLGLTAAQRIRKKETFKLLFDRGFFQRGKLLNLWVYDGPEVAGGEGPKLGIIVSKKTSLRANQRNLWKRRIREAFRTMQREINPEAAVMIQSRRKGSAPELAEISEEIKKLLDKAGFLL